LTRTLLVAGTASHVGKSTVAAGLCRYLAARGVDVAPFKAQNMSNNARAAVSPPDSAPPDGEGADGYGEVGVSQYVQARAAGVTPTTDANPVLLKPRGGGESQLVLCGRAVDHYAAGEFYAEHWERARATAAAAHRRLADRHDVVVAEGAGSIAEPNLTERDLANVETARFADAEILLVADIERGGAFASVVGTLELMPENLADRVAGVVITKFRGDRSILAPAISELEDRTGVPVLGVVPYDDPGLPEEDSVALPATDDRATLGAEDGVAADRTVTVAVPRLPRASNVTDLEPLAAVPGIRVEYVPLDASLAAADAVVLPGSKNTVDDLLALREAGAADRLRAFSGPIVGLCGGYQMLGERLLGCAVEGVGDAATVAGLGLLPVETEFGDEKCVDAVERDLSGHGPLAGASGPVTGYEIHAGETRPTAPTPSPIGPQSAATDAVVGTYLHGLFENAVARDAFVDAVYEHAGRERPDRRRPAADPYDAAATLLADHVDLTETTTVAECLRSATAPDGAGQ